MKNWDNLYMSMIDSVASYSKCPRSKVGCIILLESGLIATGINGFPEGMEEQWTDGKETNPLVTHAELNAMGKLLEEGVSAKNATVYVGLVPCLECAKLLVRAKIKRVVYRNEYRLTYGKDYLIKYGVEVEKFKSDSEVCGSGGVGNFSCDCHHGISSGDDDHSLKGWHRHCKE